MRITHLLLLATVALLLGTTGCRRGAHRTDDGLRTGRVNERRLENLRALAARDTGCHEAMLEPRALDAGIYEVVGTGSCPTVRHYVMACRNRYRCRWEPVPPVEDQAMADFGCAPDSVWVRTTGQPRVRQVFACGLTAPYELRCWQQSCVWTQAGPPQPAPPPGEVASQPPPPQP